MPAELASTDLTGPQLQALRALLAGAGPREIAQAAGVSERTLRAWKSLPAFRAGLLQGQARLLEETTLQLTLAAAAAVQTLVDVCHDGSANPSVRVAAAGKLLTLLFRNVPSAPPLAASAKAERALPAPSVAPAGTRLGLLPERRTEATPLGVPPPVAAIPLEPGQPTSPESVASAPAGRQQVAGGKSAGRHPRNGEAGRSRPERAGETPALARHTPSSFEPLPDVPLASVSASDAEDDWDLPTVTLPLDSRAAASELARLLRADSCEVATFRVGRPQREAAASGR